MGTLKIIFCKVVPADGAGLAREEDADVVCRMSYVANSKGDAEGAFAGGGYCPGLFVTVESTDKVGEDVIGAARKVGEAKFDKGIGGIGGSKGKVVNEFLHQRPFEVTGVTC